MPQVVRNYVILKITGSGHEVVSKGLKSYAGCLKWLKQHGDGTMKYQPAALIGPVQSVAEEVVTKRQLTSL